MLAFFMVSFAAITPTICWVQALSSDPLSILEKAELEQETHEKAALVLVKNEHELLIV